MKQSVVAEAPAKLNLLFDITGKRPDGYHDIDSVMQTVDLFDTITVSRVERPGIFIACDRSSIPCDENNLAHIAANVFLKHFGLTPPDGLLIHIEKRIPSMAGLGGGSADAAGVLVGLNALYGVHASREELCKVGVTIGADVPFCILGGTMRVRGIGELMSPLPPLPDCCFVLAKPENGVSTTRAFVLYDRLEAPVPVDGTGVLHGLDCADLHTIGASVANIMEQAIPLQEIRTIKEKILSTPCLGAAMSGSGSTVFGLFDDKLIARRCMHKLYALAESAFLVRPCPHGAVVTSTREEI